MSKSAETGRVEASPGRTETPEPRHGRRGSSTFAIFDAFPDEGGCEANLAGKVATTLLVKAGEFLSELLSIEKADVLASKLPAELGFSRPVLRIVKS